MARTRDQKSYEAARRRLLDLGTELIRSRGYSAVGINDVLKAGEIPKGSFYHYFESKEDFGLQIAEHYHQAQLEGARAILEDEGKEPLDRLKLFFANARKDFADREYADGCLMCNLSTELGDTNASFQKLLSGHWRKLSSVIAACISQIDRKEIGAENLSDKEAADWMLNAWSGALVRMKAVRSAAPLKLFEKTIFRN